MKIIYTSAMINQKKDLRLCQYRRSHESLVSLFGNNSITIVECYAQNIKDVSEITDLGSELFITRTHKPDIRNKGVLEILGMKKFLNETKIDEDEILLKITGRYTLSDTSIVRALEEDKSAVFAGRLTDNNTQIFTGCFSIRKRTLSNFFNNVDLDHMEKNMINFEKTLKDYLSIIEEKSIFLNKINIEAPIFGTGDIQTIFW